MFRHLSLASITALLLVTGCNVGSAPYGPPAAETAGPVCQDGIDCCTAEELVCVGDPDTGAVCHCPKAWSCDSALNPQKCWQDQPDTPDGGAGWSCRVEGSAETCVRPGTDLPPGNDGWQCQVQQGQVSCSRPTNTPDGGAGWGCSYTSDQKLCLFAAPTADGGQAPRPDAGLEPTSDSGSMPQSDTAPPQADSGSAPGWSCSKDAQGNTVCTKTGAGVPHTGAPGGGGDFDCYWKNGLITCEGSSPTPPGGGGWSCEQNALVGGWRCTKPEQPGDTPDGGGEWNCYSGTGFGGTVCVKPPPKQPGQECTPGSKMWCDGNSYCGWGQVTCGANGKWKTKLDAATGKQVLDCWELSDGRRPDTACACYFTYFNKDCCETPDCIVPPQSNGQICKASAGGYCDHCNPLKPNCTAPGAKCVVTSNNETFCGQDCSGGKPCPADSLCIKVQVGGQTQMQCVPTDLSCYY